MARYRKIRVDYWSHERTVGLSPLARDLMLQAMCANLLGALEMSVARMSRRSNVGRGHVKVALEELTSRGLAWWFYDDEILWISEAYDEQATSSPKCAIAARTILGTLPPDVRRVICGRYPNLDSGVSSQPIQVARIGYPVEGLSEQEQEQEQGIEQEQEEDPPPKRDDPLLLWTNWEEERAKLREHLGLPCRTANGLAPANRAKLNTLIKHVRTTTGLDPVDMIWYSWQRLIVAAKADPSKEKWTRHSSRLTTKAWDRWWEWYQGKEDQRSADAFDAHTKAVRASQDKAAADAQREQGETVLSMFTGGESR